MIKTIYAYEIIMSYMYNEISINYFCNMMIQRKSFDFILIWNFILFYVNIIFLPIAKN